MPPVYTQRDIQPSVFVAVPGGDPPLPEATASRFDKIKRIIFWNERLTYIPVGIIVPTSWYVESPCHNPQQN